MNNSIKKICANKHVVGAFIILSIVLIVFFSYKEIFQFYFVSGDDLVCIERGQSDVINILTTPFNTGYFNEISRFYRPVTLLFCSLDYSIWKLEPFGYYLTDIVLHALSSTLVFFLAMQILGGKRKIAWLSAVIFAIFPIFIFNVAFLALRADTLAGVFLMLSMLTFIKYYSALYRRGFYLTTSIFFYVLAFYSKETGIILPLVIFTYAAIFSDEAFFKVRMVQALKRAMPYLLATFIIFAWRAYVLKGVAAGYGADKITPRDIMILDYFNMLLRPAGFMTPSFYNARWALALPLIPLFFFLISYKRIICGAWGIRAAKILLMTGLIFSSIGIMAYSFIIEPAAKNAFSGQGHQFVVMLFNKIMVGRSHSFYAFLEITRIFFLNGLYALLFFFTICLLGIINYEKSGYPFSSSYKAKLLTFLFAWFLFPLAIYLAGANFAPYYMYIPIIPFSIFISMIFIEGFQSLQGPHQLSLLKRAAMPAIAGILILNILLSSPLINIKREVKDLYKRQSIFLHKLLDVAPELPKGANITINNIPENFEISYHMVVEHVDFFCPAKKIKVVKLEMSPPVQTMPEALDFGITTDANNNAKLNVVLKTK